MSKLRESARWCPHCMSCGTGNPNGDALCLAHSNRIVDGKGMGIKSRDEAGGIVCDSCHNIIDGRTNVGMDRLQRQDMHTQANLRTVEWWRMAGYLRATLEIQNS